LEVSFDETQINYRIQKNSTVQFPIPGSKETAAIARSAFAILLQQSGHKTGLI
jgi:hypothetical protein